MFRLVFVIAHLGEARILIEKYKLKKDVESSLPLYQNKDRSIFLILTGNNRSDIIARIAYFAGKNIITDKSILINLGISGAKDINLGEIVWVNKLESLSDSNNFFPHKSHKMIIREEGLISVDNEVNDYPENGIVDMEGYHFFQAAMKFLNIEQIAVIKIISDNKQNPAVNVNKEQVYRLFAENWQLIDELLDHYKNLSIKLHDLYQKLPEYLFLIKEKKFSFSQKINLEQNMIKLKHQNKLPDLEMLLNKSAKEIINLTS
jgi:hypothetical protein